MSVRYQIIGDDGTLVAFLEGVGKTLNEALNGEKQNVSGHKPHPPFQFQFSESPEPQANAMQMGDVSLIWITKGMLALIWTACDKLSKANAVAQLFNNAPTNQIHAALFQNQLAFVLCHEYRAHSDKKPGIFRRKFLRLMRTATPSILCWHTLSMVSAGHRLYNG
jgi:hypothetical protein